MQKNLAFVISGITAVMLMPRITAASIEQCAKIEDNDRRLTCYDLEYRIESSSSAPVGTVKSAWGVRRDKSKIDDSKSVFGTLESKEENTGRYGKPYRVRMQARCMENTTAIYWVFGGEFMADNASWGKVTFRFDDTKAFERVLDVSSDNKALGLWSGGKAIPFLRRLAKTKTLLMRYTPYNESSRTVEFLLEGTQEVVKEIAETCNWQL